MPGRVLWGQVLLPACVIGGRGQQGHCPLWKVTFDGGGLGLT